MIIVSIRKVVLIETVFQIEVSPSFTQPQVKTADAQKPA